MTWVFFPFFDLQLCCFPGMKYSLKHSRNKACSLSALGEKPVLSHIVWGCGFPVCSRSLERSWGTQHQGAHTIPLKSRQSSTSPRSYKYCPWVSPWLSGLLCILAAAEGIEGIGKADPAQIRGEELCSFSLFFPGCLRKGKGDKGERDLNKWELCTYLFWLFSSG